MKVFCRKILRVEKVGTGRELIVFDRFKILSWGVGTVPTSEHWTKIIRRIKRKNINNEKIKVCFYVNQKSKWQTEKIFHELTEDDKFEVHFVVGSFSGEEGGAEYFKKKGVPVYAARDRSSKEYDIVFYQQPWQIEKKWGVQRVCKSALTCYVPYCVYMLESELNCLDFFHPYLWRQFCDFPEEVGENRIFLGSPKLEQINDCLRMCSEKTGRKTIMYAPHHSVSLEGSSLRMGTFFDLGEEVLSFAKKTCDDFNWIFRPHPRFKNAVLESKKMSQEELARYYEEWGKCGIVDVDGDYHEELAGTDVLITDCVSFLYDFSVTGRPVIHLLSRKQRDSFTEYAKKIIQNYYKVYTRTELQNVMVALLVDEGDYLFEPRAEKSKEVRFFAKTASTNIANYIKSVIFLSL